MTDVRTSLERAAAEAGIAPERFHPVGQTRWQPLLEDILDRFTRSGRQGQRRLWFWNDLKEEPTMLVLRDAVQTLQVLPSVLPAGEPVWFIAEDFSDEKKRGTFWLFDTDTDAVVRVLAEHDLFEYYVVGRHLEWMVAENHHDVLFAVGEPVASRLATLRAALTGR